MSTSADAEIATALRESVDAAGLTATQVAARLDRSEPSAKAWLRGDTIPSGDVVVRAMREVPGFAERLGFKKVHDGSQD